MKKVAFIDELCARCNSKKFIARVWKEKIPTFSGGTTEVEYSQIECTNKECQAAFVLQREEDAKKKEAIRVKKEENDAIRKANSVLSLQKSRDNKSRI